MNRVLGAFAFGFALPFIFVWLAIDIYLWDRKLRKETNSERYVLL